MFKTALALIERGYSPDWLIRASLRRLLTARWRAGVKGEAETGAAWTERLIAHWGAVPFDFQSQAPSVRTEQLPIHFFQNVLGPRLKYSACWWPDEARDLETAEAAMLALSCERAELGFDQDILALDGGWGALTLWLAEFYPDSRIVAVPASRIQDDFIQDRCRARGFGNVRIFPADLIPMIADRGFDRILAVEAVGTLRDDPKLAARIHAWLKPGGKLFIQLISHRQHAYSFEAGDDLWLRQAIRDAGSSPSGDLLARFQNSLALEQQWRFDGRHYQRTLNAWLANQDRRRDAILTLFRQCHGPDRATRAFQRWRLSFMARAELFGYLDGEEWGIAQYRFGKPG